MVSLAVGIGLTLLAWLGLMIAVFHGKYVSEKIVAGEYTKGPFERRPDSDGNHETVDRGDRT